MENTLSVNAELAQQQEDSELGIFPTLEDRVLVLTRLKMLGASFVQVDFQGGGDSGEIESVGVISADNKEIDISNELIRGWGSKSTHVGGKWEEVFAYKDDMSLEELLKDITCDALEKSGHDWYNNDGGQGSLTIDFKESPPVINLNVGINYTSTEDYEFTL